MRPPAGPHLDDITWATRCCTRRTLLASASRAASPLTQAGLSGVDDQSTSCKSKVNGTLISALILHTASVDSPHGGKALTPKPTNKPVQVLLVVVELVQILVPAGTHRAALR